MVPTNFMFDKELHKEYILCSYLAKLLPSDKTQPFDLDNRVKLEYYRLEKTYEGAIELEATPGSWKPTQPKRAGGQKDRLSPLDEIIARINEEFFGDFTDADRVMVDTLLQKCARMQKSKKLLKAMIGKFMSEVFFPVSLTQPHSRLIWKIRRLMSSCSLMRKNTASSSRRLPSGSIANCTETQNNGGAA